MLGVRRKTLASSHLLSGLILGVTVGLGGCRTDDSAEGATPTAPTAEECAAEDLASALEVSDASEDLARGIEPPYAINSDGRLGWYAASIDELAGSVESEDAGRVIYIPSSDPQPGEVISLRYLDIAVDRSGSAVECREYSRAMAFDVTSESARHAFDLELVGSTTSLFPHAGDLLVVSN